MNALAAAMMLAVCGVSAVGPVSAAAQTESAAPRPEPVLVPATDQRDPRDGLILAPVPAPTLPEAKPAPIFPREWRGDDDFYAVVVAYDRAELAWRRFRNRHCAFAEPKRTSLSHVVKETRERLDVIRSRIDALWPNSPADRLRLLARTDAEPQQLCHDPVAAEESFQGALAGRDGTDYLIRLIERQRLAKGAN